MSMVATFPNGTIDWARVIQRYAEENEMTYRNTAHWLSKRDSLETGVQLLGLGTDGSITPDETLNSFGEWLDRHGYHVPALRTKPDLYVKAWLKDNKLSVPPKPKEESAVALDITKDQYLDMRRQGMTRAQIARKLKVRQPSLYPYLDKWGIRDRAVELVEMDKGTIYPLNPPERSERLQEALAATKLDGEKFTMVEKPIIPQAPVPYMPDEGQEKPRISMEAHVEREAQPEPSADAQVELEELTATPYVTIRIPVPMDNVEIPTQLRTMDRHATVEEVIEKLAACVQWVAMDARELTGQQDVTAMVQAYVERVMA